MSEREWGERVVRNGTREEEDGKREGERDEGGEGEGEVIRGKREGERRGR